MVLPEKRFETDGTSHAVLPVPQVDDPGYHGRDTDETRRDRDTYRALSPRNAGPEDLYLQASSRPQGTRSQTQEDRREAVRGHHGQAGDGVEDPEPKNDQNGNQRSEKGTGRLMWATQVFVLDETGGEVITITTAGEKPGVKVGQLVAPVQLEAIPWATNGRNGVAFRAIELRAAAGTASSK